MPRGSPWPQELHAYCGELRPLNYRSIRLVLWRLAQAPERSKEWEKAVTLGLVARVSEDESLGWEKHVPHQDTIRGWCRGKLVNQPVVCKISIGPGGRLACEILAALQTSDDVVLVERAIAIGVARIGLQQVDRNLFAREMHCSPCPL